MGAALATHDVLSCSRCDGLAGKRRVGDIEMSLSGVVSL